LGFNYGQNCAIPYLLRPANLHDTTVGFELNLRWSEFGGPKIIGDKGYAALGFIFPPKKNTLYNTGWNHLRHPKLRKRIESVFSPLVSTGIRSVQFKTLSGLRISLVLAILSLNLTKP
jgi:hypothetical protein